MAKKNMTIKYKSKKRERKNKETINENNELKSLLITAGSVVAFIAVVYLGALLLEKSGTFEKGYTKPEVSTTISYDNILIGTVFDRKEDEYLVLFDFFDSKENDYYVDSLIQNIDTKWYKVDMSLKENSKYLSDESNKKASNVKELKIDGSTLIKFKHGKIKDYVTGSEDIVEYLK